MKHIFIVGLIIVAFVVLSIVSFSPRLPDGKRSVVTVETPVTSPIKIVSLKDSYRRGKHTIKGSVSIPTVCYTVDFKSLLVPSTTPQVIRVDLLIPKDSGRCLELSSTGSFKIIKKAPKNSIIKVYINNTFATSTVK